MIGESLEGTPNQEVSCRKRFYAVIIVVGNSAQRAAVEASFNLCSFLQNPVEFPTIRFK